ncbi:hypothetical protein BKA66DRAFT_583289 [Pyrenochaeta sp. MPI-SDFR-AT-0127]|nr:hypothetical protein BKA66DRAFT_583289 [Pyrenochaeta sp. MPI-SDFR-AT-0127]
MGNPPNDKKHAVSLRLEQGSSDGNDKFQLNRHRLSNLGLVIITTFETRRAVELVCDSLDGTRKRLDLLGALESGLIELVDSGNTNLIAFDSTKSQQLGCMKIPPKPSPQHYQVRAGLRTDTTSERWKDIVRPGNSYDLRLSKNKGEKLSVGRDDEIIHFTVYDDPAPPKLFARLEMPRSCHLSGHSPFKFIIEYTTDSERPITIDKSRSPLSNVETEDKVSWPAAFGCFDSDPHPSFPEDADFVEVLPDKPWRFEYTLEKADNSQVGGLEDLESDQKYKPRIAGDALKGFSRWQFGRKKDLLSGKPEEIKRRWEIDEEKQGRLIVDSQNEPVEFNVVE